jgi:hypothetical protein
MTMSQKYDKLKPLLAAGRSRRAGAGLRRNMHPGRRAVEALACGDAGHDRGAHRRPRVEAPWPVAPVVR